MILNSFWIFWLTVTSFTIASPIAFQLKTGEEKCFYTLTTDVDCTISYYFSVLQSTSSKMNIDYDIFGPGNKNAPLIQRSQERRGEWSFLAEHRGEYKFCFKHGDHGNTTVELQIENLCNKEDVVRNSKILAREEQRNLKTWEIDPLRDTLDDSVDKIERSLYQLDNTMDYYKARNIRNHHTVRSTDIRILSFSIYGIIFIALIGFGQVLILQWFFQRARKHVV